MHVGEWIDLTEDTPETARSGWLKGFCWRTPVDKDEMDSGTEGRLIVWIDNSGDVNKYSYPEVEKRIYDEMYDEAMNGYNVGRLFNRMVRQNSDIPEPKKLEEVKSRSTG